MNPDYSPYDFPRLIISIVSRPRSFVPSQSLPICRAEGAGIQAAVSGRYGPALDGRGEVCGRHYPGRQAGRGELTGGAVLPGQCGRRRFRREYSTAGGRAGPPSPCSTR